VVVRHGRALAALLDVSAIGPRYQPDGRREKGASEKIRPIRGPEADRVETAPLAVAARGDGPVPWWRPGTG